MGRCSEFSGVNERREITNPAPRLYCEQRRNGEIARYCFNQGCVLDSKSEPFPEANVQVFGQISVSFSRLNSSPKNEIFKTRYGDLD